MPTTFGILSVTIRAATQDELERCNATDRANLIDGSLAVLRDGGLIGLTNEYGTVVYHEEGLLPEAIEKLAEAAGAVM